jgi:hypothetical protein
MEKYLISLKNGLDLTNGTYLTTIILIIVAVILLLTAVKPVAKLLLNIGSTLYILSVVMALISKYIPELRQYLNSNYIGQLNQYISGGVGIVVAQVLQYMANKKK